MSGTISQSATEISVSETAGSVTVTFVRTGDLSGATRLTYGVTSNSATAGQDYNHAFSTVDFAAGQSRATITIDILNDTLSELTEVFAVSLITADNGTSISVPRTLRINILDDENPAPPGPVEPPLTSNYLVGSQVLVSGLNQPLNMEFLPTNPSIVFVAEKSGLIRKFNIDTGADLGPLIDLRSVVNDRGDRGLMDIAVHPDFANNPYVYVFYVADPPGSTADGNGNRYSQVVRYTADAATGFTSLVSGSGVVIVGAGGNSTIDINGGGVLDFTDPAFATSVSSERYINPADPNPPTVINGYKQDYLRVDAVTHAGGSLAFGPDGMLYISTGDGSSANYADPRAADVQSLNSLAGKILRVDPLTGRGIASNPFAAGESLDSNKAKIFQYGLRNPFSIGFDANGQLFITDTGWNTYEEINAGGPGANFGWPWFEGGIGGTIQRAQGYQDLPAAAGFYAQVTAGTILITSPFAGFGHALADPGFQNQAITGGSVVYDGNRYPAEFTGEYFFSNFPFGRVFTIDTADRNDIEFLYQSPSTFAPAHFIQGPDGYIYYTDFGPFDGAFSNGMIGRLQIFTTDGPGVTVSAPTFATEGPGAVAEVVFTLNTVQSSDVIVTYLVTDDTALNGSDYTSAVRAEITIPAGQTSVTLPISLINNSTFELTETFRVVLFQATVNGAFIAAVDDAVIEIRDDESAPAGTNLLVNGSFEEPNVAPNSSLPFFSAPGWTALTDGRIEIWNTHNGIIPTNGVQSLELDSAAARDGFFQDVITTAGQTYTLSFDLQARPGFATSTQGVEVVWNGVVVATTTPGTGWSTFTTSVTGTGGANRLTIQEVAAQGGDGIGSMLDNFRLVASGPAAPSVSVSATPATVTEGTNPSASVTFTLSAVQAAATTVTYSTVNGTAVAGSDFTGATSATAVIPAGQTSVVVQVPILNDTVFEPSETFSVRLDGATAGATALVATGSATFTIADNDPAPASVTVAATPGTVTEGVASAAVTFTLSAVQASPVTVTYSTVNGTALAGSDFTGATAATAVIPAGQTSVVVQIPVLNDTVFEPSEAFSVRLDGATAGATALIATGSATITIADNDVPPPNLLVNGSFELPGVAAGGFAKFTSVPGWTALTGGEIEVWNTHRGIIPTDGSHSLEMDSAAARDGFFQDVTTVAGQTYALSFDLQSRPGFAISTQSVEVVWNGVVVGTAVPSAAWGTFTVNVTGTGAADRLTIQEVASQGGDGLGAMLDNFRLVTAGPPVPSVSVSATPANVTEGAGATAAVTFTLSAVQAVDTTVTYSTVNGTAVAGSDFTAAAAATAVIPAGQTSVVVQVPVLNDTVFEPSEAFSVRLDGATAGAQVLTATGSATITIADDELPPAIVTVSATPATVTEGVGASAAVTFTLSAVQAVDATVTYSTVNGTALAGSDFTGAAAATVVIPAGQTSVVVQVPVLDDTVFEPSETFSVRLDGATAGAQVLIATGSAAITIADDELPPAVVTVSATPATVTEGVGASAAVTFTLSAVQAVDATVTYSTVNGTAVAWSDFTGAAAATAVIPAGQTSVVVQVPVLDDAVFEPSETFSVRLDGAVAGPTTLVATGSAAITIANDDPVPPSVTVSAGAGTLTEGAGVSAPVTFTLSAAQAVDTVVTYSTVNGTALAGSDFTGAVTATAVIAAGQTSVVVQVPIIDNALQEPNETFSVRLDGAVSGATPLDASGSAAITIVDDDGPPPNLLVNGSFELPGVAAGGFAKFTSVPGWTALTGGQIEVWNTHRGIIPTDGVHSLEMDSAAARDGFFQDVTTVAGQTYTLTFDLRTRPGFATSTQSVEVVWNGVVVGTAVPGAAWGTFTVNVTGTGGANRLTIQEVASQGGDGIGSMLDNFRLVSDGPPPLSVTVAATPASVTEGAASASVTFTLSAVQAVDTTVTYSAVNGTAVAGSDFTGATAATAVIPAGQTSVVVQVPVLDDAVFEPSETFSVRLDGATAGATALVATGSATITIADNDPAPANVTVSATPATVTEGAGASAAVTFTLSAVQAVDTAVTYSTVNGTAVAGSDFTGAAAATAVIPAGQTSVVVQIPVLDNAVFEPSETFSVRLDGATAGAQVLIATGSAAITIADNDPPPANLLVNGSFELPGVAAGGFAKFTSVPGWTALTGGQIEVWNNHRGIVATNGTHTLEMDSAAARDGFFQDVTTVAGQTYALSFDLRTRPGFAVSTQSVEVVWNGVVVATAVPGAAWGTFTVNVTGTGAADRLTIQEVASQGGDGLGAMLDNFRLVTTEALAEIQLDKPVVNEVSVAPESGIVEVSKAVVFEDTAYVVDPGIVAKRVISEVITPAPMNSVDVSKAIVSEVAGSVGDGGLIGLRSELTDPGGNLPDLLGGLWQMADVHAGSSDVQAVIDHFEFGSRLPAPPVVNLTDLSSAPADLFPTQLDAAVYEFEDAFSFGDPHTENAKTLDPFDGW